MATVHDGGGNDLIYSMFRSHEKWQRYSSFTKSALNHCALNLRCGNGPFVASLMRQLKKQCGNAAMRVPRKNPDYPRDVLPRAPRCAGPE